LLKRLFFFRKDSLVNMAFVEFVLSAILTAILLGAAGILFYYLFLQPSPPPPEKYTPVKTEIKFTQKGSASKRGFNNKGGKKGKDGRGGRKMQKFNFTNSKGSRTKGCKNDINVGIVHSHREEPLNMSWSPSGKVLATINQSGHINVFTDIDVNEKQIKSVISVYRDLTGAAQAICVPSDDMVVVGLGQKKIAFLRISAAKRGVTLSKEKEAQINLNFDVVQMINGKHVSLREIIFMRDEGGEYLESIGLDGESNGRIKIKQGAMNDMKLSPDAKLLALCTDQVCTIFAVKPGKHGCLMKTSGGHLPRTGSDILKRGTTSAAFSDDGKCVAVAGIDEKIMVYSTDIRWLEGESPQLLHVIEPDIKQTFGLVTLVNNNQIVLSSECYLRVYDLETGKLLDEASNATKFTRSKVLCLLWRPPVNMFMTLGNDKRITAWKPTTKKI